MIDWAAIGAMVSASAVIVTLVIFMIENRKRDREARERAQHNAVSRALSTMEVALKHQSIPLPFRMHGAPERDYALLGARLIHELSAENRVVGEWVMRKAQAMRFAPSDRAAQEMGVLMTLKVVEWNEGALDLSWFRSDVKIAEQVSGRAAKIMRLRRWWSRTGQSFATMLSAFTLVEIVRRILIQLKSL